MSKGAFVGSSVGEATPRQAFTLIALPILLILATIAAILIRQWDSRGNDTFQAISTVLSFTSILVAIGLFVLSRVDRMPLWSKRVLWILASLVSIAALVAVIVFMALIVNRPDVAVGDRIEVREPHGVDATDDVTIITGRRVVFGVPAGVPPQRGRLVVSPVLNNTEVTGDCVNPARLSVNLVADGRVLPGYENVYSGQELRFSLEGIQSSTALSVGLILPPELQSCRLAVSIQYAVLYDS